MGFRYDSTKKGKAKSAPQKANGFQMLLIFIAIGVSIGFGWWLPPNFDVRAYLPIPYNWPNWTISILAGVAAFILLQFFIVLISGFLFPLPLREQLDEDGFIQRK